MIAHLTHLLTCTDTLPIRGEYKLWIYRNYIISLLRFHLCVDAVSSGTISKLESIATCFLTKWLKLPHSALYYTTKEFTVPVLLMCPGRQSLACYPASVLLLTLKFKSWA